MSEKHATKICASSAPRLESVRRSEGSVLKSPIQEPHLRRRSKVSSREDRYSDIVMLYDEEEGTKEMSTGNNLERVCSKGFLPKSFLKMEPNVLEDGESCVSNLTEDGEGFSCTLNENMVDMSVSIGEDGLVAHGLFRGLADSELSRFQDVSDRYSRMRSILLDSSGESSFSSKDTDLKRCSSSRPVGAQCQLDQMGTSYLTYPDETDEKLVHREETIESNDELNESKARSSMEGSTLNRMPKEGQSDSFLLWPVGLAVDIIAFQVYLIAHVFSMIATVFNWCNSFTSNRVCQTIQAKERATEALTTQKVAMVNNVPPKVTESGSTVLKRAAWGCLAAVYVFIFLSMLLFPALLLGYVFLSKIVEEPVRIKEPIHLDYTLPHPTAVVFLHPSGVHGSMGKAASYINNVRPISISHKLLITVIMSLPESDYNRNLGMFQLTGELLSEDDRVIKSSSRPCMLRFHSAPIRMVKTFLVSLPALVGVFTESQTLVIPLMEFEGKQVSIKAVRILLQPKAGMPVGQGIPELYSAEVVIDSRLPWLKELVRNWKWTIFIWTGLMLYLLEVTMVLCCCRQALVPTTWAVGQIDDEAEEVADRRTRCETDTSLRSQMLKKHALESLDEIPTARVL